VFVLVSWPLSWLGVRRFLQCVLDHPCGHRVHTVVDVHALLGRGEDPSPDSHHASAGHIRL
jgi:hypothetical protein